jgi:predicted RNA binding protein YcfA (HicA-like mRNA interferase family)
VPPKEGRTLVRQLRSQGFEVERSGSGHYRVYKNGGPFVMIPFSGHSRHPKTIKKLRGIGADL